MEELEFFVSHLQFNHWLNKNMSTYNNVLDMGQSNDQYHYMVTFYGGRKVHVIVDN